MKRSAFVTILIVLILPFVVLPLLSVQTGVVMNATVSEPDEQGSIEILNAGVHATLTLAHYDCDLCYMGLWNGGRINGDAQMFDAVQLYDWANIVTSDYRVIAECIDIGYAMEGTIQPDGDVLVCVKTAIPLVMKVYRFTIL